MKIESNPFELVSPDYIASLQKMWRESYVLEGIMVAMPQCLPGFTLPITHDESAITALDVLPDGTLYGGTSGYASHLTVARFKGISGIVLDLGTVPEATECVAVCCGDAEVLGFHNGASGGVVVSRKLQLISHDLVQEWGFPIHPIETVGTLPGNARIVHAVSSPDRKRAIGISETYLFTVDFAEKKITVVAEFPGKGQLAVCPDGSAIGFEGDDSLWLYAPGTGELVRKDFKLPEGNWTNAALGWAKDPHHGLLYTTDGDGNLYSFTEEDGFSQPLGRVPLLPVGPMAVTFDGRLFGMCGDGIGRLFTYHPRRGEVRDLGVVVSVLQARRYGYQFGAAVTGIDGEIVFGERDNNAHLWQYFPKIEG